MNYVPEDRSSVISELEAIVRGFEELAENLAAFTKLDCDVCEQAARLETAEANARRGAELIELLIQELRSGETPAFVPGASEPIRPTPH